MKRGRGRGGRKPTHSANRTLESNGPDVKVRGTAHQICEKYQALARDAHASGDRIAHENYLQHAEHYHRIILATQQAAQESAPQNRLSHDMDDGADEGVETNTPEDENDGDAEAEAEAPRAQRARRGRRTRSDRSNGHGNGAGDDTGDAVAAKAAPSRKAKSGDAEAPVESA